MKLFTLLSTVAFAAAALSPAQQNAAQAAFRRNDKNHKGDLTSGGVYAALMQLDSHLTEAQLQKAAGHNKKKVTLKQFMQLYAKLEGAGNSKNGGSKFPKGCQNWYDGCNHCIIKNGKELGCTKMYCGQIYDGPKKKPFCTVFADGRRCKSATSCKTAQKYNCYTREVWSAAKKVYCCKTKKQGCSQTAPKQTLKANQVCYSFSEQSGLLVNKKNNCPKGYKCAAQKGVYSFNTVMRCLKSSGNTGSSGGIPKNCVSWNDGCNTCGVKNGKKTFCTKRACFRQGKAYCKQYQKTQQPYQPQMMDGDFVRVHG